MNSHSQVGQGKEDFNRAKKMAFIASFLLLLFCLYGLFSTKEYSYASDLTVDNILQAVNHERTSRNLLALNTNSMLGLAAQNKATDMIKRHYFAHVNPDGNYIWPDIVAAGYTPYAQLGENLAIEFYDTQSLVSAWMNSPTHRANILQEGFVDQGGGLDFGNVESGQYHSAIANTFGALLIKKVKAATVSSSNTQPKAPTPPEPKPAAQTSSTPPPSSTPPVIVQPAEPVNPQSQSLAIRSGGQPDLSFFTFPDLSRPIPTSVGPQTSTPLVSQPAGQAGVSQYKINRYFILLFGSILLIFLLSDIKIVIEQKLKLSDKKINNIILLTISLIVVAIMYWL